MSESCIVSDPEPPVIVNGNMTARGVRYNTAITCTCDGKDRMENGYRELTIYCVEDGEWSHTSFSCGCMLQSPSSGLLLPNRIETNHLYECPDPGNK